MAVIAAGIAGCATEIPQAVRQSLPEGVSLFEVQSDPASHIGRKVRWGGSIVTLENRTPESWVEVLERPLDSDGRPKEAATSSGRFLAVVDRFLDPAVYAAERELTVVGVVTEFTTRPIGGYQYSYPVVRVDTMYLWERRRVYPREPYPWPYPDPFWPYPWYPGCPYPYPRCW